MILEQQVCSPELAKKLKELGVKQNGFFCWWWNSFDIPQLSLKAARADNAVVAYTVAELGEMLPMGSQFTKVEDWACRLEYREDEWIHGDTEADARAKMLIYLIENGMIK